MKKLMFAAVAAFCATVVANADGITSANVVGYNKVEIPDNYFKIATAPFEAIDGSMEINKLLSGMNGVDYDDQFAFRETAPQIQIPKGNSYEILYYLNDGYYDDGTTSGKFEAGWCDMYGSLATSGNPALVAGTLTEFTPGEGYWVKDIPGGGDVQVAGAVSSDNSIDIACDVTFKIRGGAFPINVEVNSSALTSDDIVGVDYDDQFAFRETAPQIQIPKGNSYEILYYLNDGYYDDGTTSGKFEAGWCDMYGSLATSGNPALVSGTLTAIPAGVGFWIKGVTGALTLTFNNPISE